MSDFDAIKNANDNVDPAHSAQQLAARGFLSECDRLKVMDEREYQAFIIGQAMKYSSPSDNGFYYDAIKSKLREEGLVSLVEDLRRNYVDNFVEAS